MGIEEQTDVEKNLKLVASSSIVVFIGILISKIFSYAYKILIFRNLGAEVYGIFSLSIIIIAWFIAIASFGFSEGIIRFISIYRGKNENEKIKFLFQFSLISLIFSSLIFAILSFLFSDFISNMIFHDPQLLIFLRIFSVMLPFWAISSFLIFSLRGFEKITASSVIEKIIQNVFKFLILAILLYFGFKSFSVSISFFSGIFIMFICSLLYLKIKIPWIFKKYSLDKQTKKKVICEFISYSWPILFLGVIYSTFYWTDSFFIGFFKSTTEVGIYNVVVSIALLLGLVPELFLQLFFPLITKEYSNNKIELICTMSKQISKWIFMLNIPIFILFFLFPGTIINLLFGPESAVAIIAFRFLLLSSLISSVFVISENLLSMAGKSKTILFDLVIASVTNIILNYILIPLPNFFGIDNSLGINGAAFATMISVLLFNILIFIHAKSATTIVPLRRKMFGIFLSSLIPLGFLLFVKNYFDPNFTLMILLTITFFLIYALCLFIFKAFDKNDWMILNVFKNRLFQRKITLK